jgi:RNA ligase (TIGR02306 family)
MSEVIIEAVAIESVVHHPDADRLDILTIGGYTVCEPRDKYKAGDIVAYFPPDILIPPSIANQLGVSNYLKTSIYPGDCAKSKCHVSCVRLRGCPSFGFVVSVNAEVGTDLTERFHGKKYEPEVAYYLLGDCERELFEFHRYTNIENYRNRRFTDLIPEGTPVRITEKCHGTNSRTGLIKGAFYCGSHNTCKKDTENCLYWKPLRSTNLKAMLEYISMGKDNVIAFGEILGSRIQFMDYGFVGATGYLLFDISVNGVYLDWEQVKQYANKFDIPLVPLLYTGPFSRALVEQLVDGPTKVSASVQSSFKGREGIVITPLKERISGARRMILKAVSVDYLSIRKSDGH